MYIFKKRQYFLRIKEVLFLLISFGFIKFLEDVKLAKYAKFVGKFMTFGRIQISEDMPQSVRFRKLVESLGTTFIKVGQFLQTKPHLLPEEYISELKRLNDKVTSQDFEIVKNTVERELSCGHTTIFEYLEEQPVAAASIAQVHKGRLKNGKIVALKVKREGIAERIKIDLKIIKWLAEKMQKHLKEAERYNFVELADEFSDQLMKELDFELEAKYMDLFKKYFEKMDNVVIPTVYWEYTTSNLITMDFIDGMTIDNVDEISKKGLNTAKIAALGVDIYLKQVFEFKFFHADPHPGNFLVTNNGHLALIDFGIIGKVDNVLLKHLGKLFIAIVRFDIDGLLEEFISFGVLDKSNDLRKIRNDLYDILLPIYDIEIKKIDMVKLYNNIIGLSRKYIFRFPRDYLLIMKTFSFLESEGRALCPEFNAIQHFKPYARKIMIEKYNPEFILKKLSEDLNGYIEIIQRFPKDYKELYEKLISDNVTINFMHKGLDSFANDMNKASNKLSFSILISAIVLASSIFVYTGAGPKLFNIPVFGLLGFTFAGILGLGLAIAILRTGKL
jgi:ubiquinone biosynthesis protein